MDASKRVEKDLFQVSMMKYHLAAVSCLLLERARQRDPVCPTTSALEGDLRAVKRWIGKHTGLPEE